MSTQLALASRQSASGCANLIPAKAGIQKLLDSGFRRNDKEKS
jgi:hypothetical protein